MSLRKSFSRNKETENELTSEMASAKELITKWAQNEGWKLDFATFVELIGVKTPIKLIDWDENSFKCVTALNTEVTIHICFGDWLDFCSELLVTEGDETRKYIITNSNSEVPKVTLQKRTVTRNGRELSSYYCEYFCYRTLKIDDTHMLRVEIDEPNGGSFDNPDVAVLKNCQQVEEYLLSLDSSLIVAQVYDRVMELLGFSNEDISNSGKILFSYIETVGEEKRTRSEISKANGIMQEYAVLEDGETFHVSRDGWTYLSNDTRIVYLKKQNHHVFSITGTEESITTSNPAETMKRVKERISKLMDFVK